METTAMEPTMPCTTCGDLKRQLDRIEKAIVGDETMGHVGVIHRLNDHQIRITTIEIERKAEADKKHGAVWVLGVASSIAAAVGAVTTWAINIWSAKP